MSFLLENKLNSARDLNLERGKLFKTVSYKIKNGIRFLRMYDINKENLEY